jgi:hypothetical protein
MERQQPTSSSNNGSRGNSILEGQPQTPTKHLPLVFSPSPTRKENIPPIAITNTTPQIRSLLLLSPATTDEPPGPLPRHYDRNPEVARNTRNNAFISAPPLNTNPRSRNSVGEKTVNFEPVAKVYTPSGTELEVGVEVGRRKKKRRRGKGGRKSIKDVCSWVGKGVTQAVGRKGRFWRGVRCIFRSGREER